MTALSICIGADAQTVGGVELLHEEGAAGLNHSRQLQKTRGRQQGLNGVLPQLETAWTQKEGIEERQRKNWGLKCVKDLFLKSF